MAGGHTSFVLHRILMPTIYIFSALLRPSAISLVYLMLFFILPFISVPVRQIQSSAKALYIVSITVSIILLLCHVSLQISLLVSVTIRDLVVHCSFMEILLRHIGFIRMDDFKNYLAIIEWITPDLIVFIGSILVFVGLRKTISSPASEEQLGTEAGGTYPLVDELKKPSRRKLLKQSQIGALICLITLFLTSAIRPSAVGGFYFLIFLLSGTYWACYKTLERGFGIVMRVVLLVLALHICVFVTYQTPWVQDFFGNNTLPVRLAGLQPLFIASCNQNDIRIITINNAYGWDSFIFPIVMLTCYYIIASNSIIFSQTHLMIRTKKKDSRQINTTETVQDITSNEPEQEQDELKDEIEPSSIWRNMQDCFESLVEMACEHSYLFTSITMMTWSIIYHSWLTFVFLIWANILWMIPNQRQAMLRSSPFIVLYAEFLLIATYIYGMKLEEGELPTHVDTPGISLEQIGFLRPPDPVCVPLIVKVVFTSIFWITLRQLCKESIENNRPAMTLISEINARRQTSQDVSSDTRKHNTSQFLKSIGQSTKNILVKSWIWLLILVIFLCAISGKKMTGFRIFYMALFLFFLLAFQISWVGWMKVMFGYWVFLIIYAMFTLVLIYTYQFQNFPSYWENYLGIPNKLQNDIGLEIFEVKGLFLHLFAPTIIVIMTAIQVHYIHKEFIASLRRSISSRSQPYDDIKNDNNDNNDTNINDDETNIAIEWKIKQEQTEQKLQQIDEDDTIDKPLNESKKDIWLNRIKNVLVNCRNFLNDSIEFTWTIFEVHLVKVIFIVAFVCCIKTVSVLHLAFVIFCVIAVTSREQFQVFFSRLIAVIMAILILAKMIYQIEYIDHKNYNIVCNYSTSNISYDTSVTNSSNTKIEDNNAEWFGFTKTSEESGNLFNILNGYVVFMIIVTLHEISVFRKAYINSNYDIEYKRPKVIFPGITRQNAEDNLKGLLKYLFNYAYYKFGFEITLIMLVTSISYHQDLPALLYSIWLCIFVVLGRSRSAKLWPAFLIFTSALIPLQYIVFVGLPPGLCIDYPWRNVKGLSEWSVLPGHRGIHDSTKLLFDFILLMFISRQQKVFNIEEKIRKSNTRYAGGSNESIVQELSEQKNDNFQNPTVNFMERVRNWSDIIKVFVFNGFFWITLTIVFLAATQTINLFSIGYLIGTFIFLWQGTDFYLRPLKQIAKWWNCLIFYNVLVIAIQTALQIAGCLFFDTLQDHACWLIHLLGIGCASSDINETSIDLKMCPATYDEEGVIWDVVCFAFLITQLRIFSSYYFCHVISEARASALLAERGAELIEDLRQKEFQYREKQEQKILRKIKKKMEKIRATQQRTLGSEKATHYDEYGLPVEIRGKKLPTTHASAIRAGDYYMFDDVDEKFELDLLPEEEDYLGATGKISTSEKKLKDRKTLLEDKPDQPTDSSYEGKSKESLKKDKETEESTQQEKEDKRPVIIRLLEALLVSLAVKLNRYSRQYRYVMRVLAKEKKALKESPEFVKANRTIGEIKVFAPYNILQIQQQRQQQQQQEHQKQQKQQQSKISDGRPSSSSSSHDTPTVSRAAVRHSATHSDIRTYDPSEPDSNTSLKDSYTDSNNKIVMETVQKDLQRIELESEDTSSRKMRRTSTVPEIRVLAPSLERGLDDTTSTVLDKQHLKDKFGREDEFDDYDEDDFTSQDHPVFIEFLIALWYAILANTDFVCYFVVFLNQVVSASILSLPLPFMVFMWGTLSLPRPTKTFWVTLIAYTLSVVLIKCIFQFKMIWYDYLSLPNQPLSAATIIGIESRSNYATLDLFLLLILFFHRYILKSQGLWKSSYRIDNIHDGVYILKEKIPQEIDKNRFQKTDDDVNETAIISKDDQTLVLSKEKAENITDSEQIHVHVTSTIDEPANYLPGVVKMTSAKYCSSITGFFKDLIHMSRLPCDVYAFMFLCDFTNFFVLLLGFTAFGSQHGDGGVQTYLAENKVPIPFLIMLLIQFFLIIADRAIYLRKSLVHKIIYHYFTIIGIHIWMFFVVPGVTERKFNALAPPIIFYMVKCFYFLLSSYQIRCGYPKRILGNFLCKGFTIMNMIFFKIYMIIPFLYELRTFLDWVCTESTFTVFDWLKMEDIFAEIFILKCGRQMEKDFPVPRATRKPMLTKIIMGGLAVVAIVVLIWAPLTLFALNSAVGYANVPFRATALLQIGPYEPIYEIRTADSIKAFTLEDMEKLQNAYRRDKTALTFITSYDEDDIAAILLQTNSPELWKISPPGKKLLMDDLEKGKDVVIHFSYTISRSPPNKQLSETLSAETKYVLTQKSERDTLRGMLNGTNPDGVITLKNTLPKFIKIKNSGEMSIVTQLTPDKQEYRNITVRIYSDPKDPKKIWWEIKESCNDDYHKNVLKNVPYNKVCDMNVTLITFNDKKFPETFSFLTAGGIIGMYTTFILVAARVLRSSLITGASRNIMFEDLPYVDRVLQLCLDIYLVREAQEFALEEDLFAKLIFLYRSPETMIKWTRPKEKEDESDETGSVQSRSSRRTIK